MQKHCSSEQLKEVIWTMKKFVFPCFMIKNYDLYWEINLDQINTYSKTLE